MNCTFKDNPEDKRKSCKAKVTEVIITKIKKIGRCVNHPYQGEFISRGPACPCCVFGQTKWSHVERGRCFRCGGKGHW